MAEQERGLPGYIQAAGIHSVSSNKEGGILDSIANAPKFWGLALGSGVASIANSFISVGNLFAPEESKAQQLNFGKWVAEYDSDWGKYYQQNAESIDTWGFIGTSFIPGVGGMKALNMGQKALVTASSTGNVGKGLSWATGLMVPKTETYIAQAGRELARRAEGFKWMQQDALKAVGSKFHQNLLESFAFETAVLATMHQSPFLDEMEASDVAWNFALGGVLGGVIGGGLGAFGARKAIKQEVLRLDEAGKAARYVEALPANAPEGAKLSMIFKNREAIERYKLNPLGETAELRASNLSTAGDTERFLNTELITQVRKMTLDGDEVGVHFASKVAAVPSPTGKAQFLGVEKFARVAEVPRLPVAKGMPKGTVTPVEEGWNYVRLWGEEKGKILDQAALPKALPLADAVGTKQGAKNLRKQLDATVAAHRHRLDDKHFSVAAKGTTLESVQTRYMHVATKGINPNWKKPVRAYASDLPVLEALRGDFPQGGVVHILDKKGKPLREIYSGAELETEIVGIKELLKQDMIAKGFSPEEIGERLNVSPGWVTGLEVSGNQSDNLFYRQAQAKAEGLDSYSEIFYQPKFMGMKAEAGHFGKLAPLEADADVALAAQQKASQQTIDFGVAQAQSEFTDVPDFQTILRNLPEADTVNEAAVNATRFGPDGGVLTFMNGNYLDATGVVQYLGSQKGRADQVMFDFVDSATTRIRNLFSTDHALATEFNVIAQQVHRTAEKFVLDESGSALVPKKLKDYEAALARGENAELPSLNPGTPERIELASEELQQVVKDHIAIDDRLINARKALRSAQGRTFDIEPGTFYAPKPDPRKYKHHVLVSDPTVSGAGHTSMVHAASKQELENMIANIREQFPQFSILTRQDTDEYFKAIGSYERGRSISENHVDYMLASRGVNSQFLPRTDGNLIADDLVSWYKSEFQRLNTDIWNTKYERAFREMELRGREFSRLESASYDTLETIARTEGRSNPYVNMIKTALNISSATDVPVLGGVNKWLDDVVSGAWNRAASALAKGRTIDDGTLDAVNQIFERHGFKTAYYDSKLWHDANHPAGQQVLSKFVRGVNGILATTFLRWDFIQALNNKLGSVILTSSELRNLLRGIETGNEEMAGKLAQLAKTKVPGTNDWILSPQKLIARSLKEFVSNPEKMATYKALGFVSDNLAAARGIIDDLALTGKETSGQLRAKLDKAFHWAKQAGEFGEKWTGNKTVEELNRFLAADISGQIAELAVANGVITAREARVIQNTFVNRTQVNLNRAQRPLIFQGPIGQAMGLFQSYQFNLMQQLFRYVQPGNRKTGAMLMGMQTSFYGLNSIPGFQEFNEYIIGQASGNYEHRDLYDSIFQAAGADAASWLMYGAPSNILQTNLYVRGDLTPQHATILPTSPWDFPVVAKAGQFFGNLKDTLGGIADGQGVWQSLLTGLEHNSINRPLSGLASVLRASTGGGEVYATDRRGNLLSSNDLLSLATLSRLAGGRPIDEAIARDEAWRTSVYRRADNEAKKELGIKAKRMLGGDPNTDPYQFMEEYVQLGGKQAGFNAWWMRQLQNATTAQAELARQKLTDPYSRRMQILMGGMDPEDFSL